MLKKGLALLITGALLLTGALAQEETVTETKNGFTVTFPIGFTMDSNGPTSFSLTAEDGTQVNFATAAELENSLGLTPSNAEEAFDQLIDAVIRELGLSKAQDGALSQLKINGAPAPVQKVSAPDGNSSFYFGIMTLKDGSWGLIGFTPNFDTEPTFLEAIYNTIEVAPPGDLASIAAIGAALRPSEMPAGKGVLFSSRGNIVFNVSDALRPAGDDPVFESVTYQVGTNGTVTVLTIDISFANSLDTFLESYIKTLAEVSGHTDFVFADDVATLTQENGATSYVYNSALHVENGALFTLVAVKGIENNYGVIIQATGMASDRETLENSAQEIFETLLVIPRSVDAVATPESDIVITDELPTTSEDGTDCHTLGYNVVDATAPEKVVTCPAGCNQSNSGLVWGTDIYTNDSSVCAAAIHAGVISPNEGGQVLVSNAAGQSRYEGSERNGIATLSYGAWGSSFTVGKP